MNRKEQLRQAVKDYHEKHPEVFKLFDQFTRDRIKLGFKNYGAMAIFQRIRWELDKPEYQNHDFKINNNYSAFYARAWMKLNPEHDGFFRTRRQISVDEPALGLPELKPAHFEHGNWLEDYDRAGA